MNKLTKRLCAALLGLATLPAAATEPAEGTLSADNRSLSASGGPYVVANPAADCSLPDPACDRYTLTVDLPADYATTNPDDKIVIDLTWSPQQTDLDLLVEDASGAQVGSSGNLAGVPEQVVLPVVGGRSTYTVLIVPFAPGGASATLAIQLKSPPPPSTATVSIGGPRFDIFNPPPALADASASEPTLAVSRATGNALMVYAERTLKTQWVDESFSPAKTEWTEVTDPASPTTGTLDPILTGDEFPLADGSPGTRIIVSQLQGAMSVHAVTDDEGATWTLGQGGGQPHGADNQSVAIGPYPEGLKPLTALYDNASYYCSHSIVNAFCSRSDNGGLSYNPSRPIFPAEALCSNHGHVQVGPDGTVYVPMNNSCEGSEGVSLSIDAGETWHYIAVPETVQGRWDPGIGIANDGRTLYFGYAEQGVDKPMILKGTLNKSDPANPTIDWDPRGAVEVGGPFELKNIVFNTVVAGDPDRAAYAFHGTTTAGDSGQAEAMVDAVWHLYVATTFDGGASWQVRNLTPGQPTQKGAICDQGINCPTTPPDRNLLDFMDMVIDAEGRLVVGYADGCVGLCESPGGPPSYSQFGAIARQVGGPRMYAAFDPAEPALPKRPWISGTRNARGVTLSWQAPDDQGSPISGYRIFRGTSTGNLSLLTTTSDGKAGYVDASATDLTVDYFYQVEALNGIGGSGLSNEVQPAIELIESACELPGITVARDPQGDSVDGGASSDIEFIAIAEPALEGLDDKIVFTFKVGELPAQPAPGLRWAIRFTAPQAPPAGQDDWFVMMTTENGAPEFVYGNTGIAPDPTLPAGARVFTVAGDLDAASGFAPDGTITLVLDRAVIGDPQPGQALVSIIAAVRTPVTPQNNGILDDTADASYAIAGNQPCAGEGALPLAVLTATPRSGTAPLTVRFDAGSSTDAASFRFEFGDGTPPVEQDSPVIEHTYTRDGIFPARLIVRSAEGVASSNKAETIITVGNVPGNGGGGGDLFERDRGRFGGALGAGALGLLALLAALRRRGR
ncbi:MAG TPA: PKD domain-containing protein [Nevskiaceae bacterium]|nr:PKD domain-containing protein [Nevskiaceae bacterium]